MPTPTPKRETDQQLPDRVTMPLLALVTRESLDQDYVHAARRRAAGGEPPARSPDVRGVAAVTAVFGLMIALAAVQTARNADVDQASRDALVDRIDERKAEVDGLEERLDDLDDQLAELEAGGSRLRGQLAEQTVALRSLQVATGFVPVVGPGLRITVDDNPDGSEDGLVRASDLRRLVNGLWVARADAIAINGRRLTVRSPITQAGIAIQVNGNPLSPPYVVTAIGGEQMASAVRSTTSGVLFESLAQQFGFEVDRVAESEVELPAASPNLLRLRYAERPTADPDNQDSQEDLP